MPGESIVYLTAVDTVLGWVGLAWGEGGLLETTLPQPSRPAALDRLRAGWPDAEPAEPTQIAALVGTLRRYAQGEGVTFEVCLDGSRLTPFQRRVYRLTQAIPRGTTRTYADLARQAGSPGAARAVGQCMARNPWPILVPCHRVVGSGGQLTGFGGGLAMKRRLLEMEGAMRAETTQAACSQQR
jgi:methylated-DNA-[protein]-cysteine S-methyltransferase